MTKERLFYLLHRYMQYQLSTDEERELMAYMDNEESQQLLDDVMAELGETFEVPPDYPIPTKEMFEEIKHDHRFRINKQRGIRKLNTWQSFALVISGIAAIWLFLFIKTGSRLDHPVILPGKKTAVLTLANGEKVSLEAEGHKLISVGGGRQIQVSDGKVVYQQGEKTLSLDAEMENTVATPLGGEYQLILPDGTKVWLNAASSIRYPVDFGHGARKVTISGEVYLEVAQQKNQPFYVRTGNTQIEVLGTKFNVSAYQEDQEVRTTLVEGRVNVLAYGREQLLKPGQQATVNQKNGPIRVAEVDVEDALAWRNGYFSFSNEPLEQVMKKISRWYNVEVEYAMDPANKRLEGTVSRMEDIHDLLKVLELTKTAHFKIKEGRIIVMN